MNVSQNRGSCFAHTIKAIGVGKENSKLCVAWAEGQGLPNVRAIVTSIKAAVDAVSTLNNPIASPASMEFAEFVRPLSILGKLTAARKVPTRVRAIAAVAGSGASWSGPGQPCAISRLTLAGESMEPLRVTSIVVTSVELLDSSDPSSISIIENDCSAASAEAIDSAFIDPSNAGVANEKPASITYGVAPIESTGQTLAAVDADLASLILALSNAGSNLATAVFILHPRSALFLSRLRGSGGALAYPEMGVNGGTLLGLPAITSTGVPISVGSPGGNITSISLIDQSQILILDDDAGEFNVIKDGPLLMSDAPGSGAQSMTSLFQTHSAAIRTARYVNFKRARDGMAQVLTEVTY